MLLIFTLIYHIHFTPADAACFKPLKIHHVSRCEMGVKSSITQINNRNSFGFMVKA
jgi:hypothetical protein